MRRRDFITLLGVAAAAWSLPARAQQSATPVIGYLDAGSPEQAEYVVAAFRKGLSEIGYVEGRNVAIEFRWAHNENAQLPELAADLVRRRVAVIVTPQSTASGAAAKAATTTIPIVFGTGADPVKAGLVASLDRPGGNVTGITFMNVELAAKRLGLLHELLPGAARFAVIVNPNNPLIADPFVADVQSAVSTLGGQVDILTATSTREIDRSFASLVQSRCEGLLVAPDTLLVNSRVHLARLAARHGVPTIYPNREYAEVGGLMTYGTRLADAYRQTGIYAGRILKGAKPSELPVMRATKFELVINLQTARAMGLAVSPDLLSIADEVIE